MKVIIADDEVHICSLLRHEIDWEGLGLKLLGTFHNAGGVIEQFEKEAADILITDIEMPGMSGNELIGHIVAHYPGCSCVVISGFRNFEYAREAMKYGVTEYLLKPVSGPELNEALKRICASQPRGDQASPAQIISDQAIRFGIMDEINNGSGQLTLAGINNKYHYNFVAGKFCLVKAVFTDIDIASDHLPKIMGVFAETIKQKMKDFYREMEVLRQSLTCSHVIINYETQNEAVTRALFDRLLRDTLIELSGKTQCRCYFGVGISVDNIHRLADSKKSAEVVSFRLKDRTRQIFYAEFENFDLAWGTKSLLTHEGRSEIAALIERIDTDGIGKWLGTFFAANKKVFWENPQNAFSAGYNIGSVVLQTFDALGVPVVEKNIFRRQMEMFFDNCSTFLSLEKALFAMIEAEIVKRLFEKQQNVSLYAQQAKKYIDAHYAEAVTLELIAEHLNINPVYLSVVFKSGVGMNYSKYLAQVRVEKSKQLLKDYKLNLTQVANAVGYDSANYFSSLFRKLTGIKPSEYRRLHQHNIGD